jgi:hypothetical protein
MNTIVGHVFNETVVTPRMVQTLAEAIHVRLDNSDTLPITIHIRASENKEFRQGEKEKKERMSESSSEHEYCRQTTLYTSNNV